VAISGNKRTNRSAKPRRPRSAVFGQSRGVWRKSPISVTSLPEISHGNLQPYATASREKPVMQVEPRPTNILCSGPGLWGEKGSSCRQRTAAASECAPGHGHGSRGDRQNAPRGGGGEWACRELSGWDSFCTALPAERSGLDRFRDRSDVGIREAGGQSPLEILKKNLQDSCAQPMLFLLDNFEHLVQAAPTVAELLAMAPILNPSNESRSAARVRRT